MHHFNEAALSGICLGLDYFFTYSWEKAIDSWITPLYFSVGSHYRERIHFYPRALILVISPGSDITYGWWNPLNPSAEPAQNRQFQMMIENISFSFSVKCREPNESRLRRLHWDAHNSTICASSFSSHWIRTLKLLLSIPSIYASNTLEQQMSYYRSLQPCRDIRLTSLMISLITSATWKRGNTQCPMQRIHGLSCCCQCFISANTISYQTEFNTGLSGTIPPCNSVVLSQYYHCGRFSYSGIVTNL